METTEIKIASTEEDRKWAMFIHFSVFASVIIPIAGVLAPIIIWQLKKESPFIDMHGKEVVNFIITALIYCAIAAALTLILIGIAMFWLIGIWALVVPIIAGIKANEGKFYEYPFIFRFIQ